VDHFQAGAAAGMGAVQVVTGIFPLVPRQLREQADGDAALFHTDTAPMVWVVVG